MGLRVKMKNKKMRMIKKVRIRMIGNPYKEPSG